jgi:hypothetical protein
MVSLFVVACLEAVSLSSRDDPDEILGLSVATADDQKARTQAHAKQDEALLICRVIWVGHQSRSVIEEH